MITLLQNIVYVWPNDDNLFCLVENLSVGNGRN